MNKQQLSERNDNLDCENPHEVEVNCREPEELMACLEGKA